MKKIKRIICVAISLMLFGLTACTPNASEPTTKPQPETPADQPQTEKPASQKSIKIGIMTGTVSQGEEEFYAAENMKAKYGDMIEIATYPDNFEQETETLISNTLALAENGAEAIIFVQAVQGTAAAIDKVRESYPDMLFICGASTEDPAVIASKADIVMNIDEIGMGVTIIEQAKKLGAKTFVHYTFPRHMSYEAYSDRRDLLKETCEANGMQFVDATIPDPTSEDGVAGAESFIVDDVPRMVEKYGKDTAFFATDCEVQEKLIKMVLQEGALYPQQCDPSPFHAYPGALGITIPDDKKGDVSYVLEQIQNEITVKGGNGRFSTWLIPANMLFVEAGVEYAISYLKGEITDRNDKAALENICNDIIGGGTATLTNYETSTGEALKNYYFILLDFINF